MTTKASKNDAGAEKEKWKELVLSSMLRALHKKSEKESGRKLTGAQQVQLDEARGIKARSFNTTLSQAKAFMVGSGARLIKQMMSKGGTASHDKELKQFLNNAIRVEKAISGEEKALGFFLPDFMEDATKRWPGPVGYRVAINHLVAVSIRIHSIFPAAEFDRVIGLVAKDVLVPILAHNLTFVARSHPKTFKSLMRYLGGTTSGGATESAIDMDETDEDLYLRWVRLFACIEEFAPSSFDISSARHEIQDLVNERGDNPTSSRLWSGLAIFASGDLAIDEILVAKIIKDNEEAFGLVSNLPLVNCARSRFGLLKYSYAMEDEKELLQADVRAALTRAKEIRSKFTSLGRPEHFDEQLAKQSFGWAYLLSRRILLGRKEDSASAVKECQEISKVLDSLLTAMSDAKFLSSKSHEVRAHGALALRYRAGFRSNPRFVADTNATDVSNYIEEIIPLLKENPEISVGIIYMVKARNALHAAFVWHDRGVGARALREVDHAIAHYGMTLDSIVGEGFIFDDESRMLTKGNIAGVMDGEVAAWCIPEMVTALSIREEWSATRTEKESLRRLCSALAVVGEVQFGIYFNKDEEADRIKRGLKLRCRPKFQS